MAQTGSRSFGKARIEISRALEHQASADNLGTAMYSTYSVQELLGVIYVAFLWHHYFFEVSVTPFG